MLKYSPSMAFGSLGPLYKYLSHPSPNWKIPTCPSLTTQLKDHLLLKDHLEALSTSPTQSAIDVPPLYPQSTSIYFHNAI